MKKEDIASIIVYLLMIGAAVVVGLTAVRDVFLAHYHFSLNNYVFAILAILAALIVNIVGLEVFHVLGAKAGHYKILSVNVLWLCLRKKDGKWKLGFKDFDGLTGETKVAPKDEKSKLGLYVWLPVLAYFVELIACIVIYTLAGDKSIAPTESPLHWMAVAAILFIVVSSMIALYNLVPIKLDSMTDGYRLTLISKKENMDAYNELMRIEALQLEGKEVGEIKVFSDITEFTASINLMSVYEEYKKNNYARAEELIDMIIVDPKKVSSQTYNRLLSQKLYIKIMTLPLEEVKVYYDKQIDDSVRKFIANDLSIESLRTYILIAGLLDESNGEVEFAVSRKDRALKRAAPSRAETEKLLYENALKKVYEAHPDWKANTQA